MEDFDLPRVAETLGGLTGDNFDDWVSLHYTTLCPRPITFHNRISGDSLALGDTREERRVTENERRSA
jgi:hypothetical protein